MENDLKRDDLISRSKLLSTFKRWDSIPSYNEGERNIIKAAIYETEIAPAVDAVEVVRCRECMHSHIRSDPRYRFCERWRGRWNPTEPLWVDDENYCAWGQRREDGDA